MNYMKIRISIICLVLLSIITHQKSNAQINANAPQVTFAVSNLNGTTGEKPTLQINLDFSNDLGSLRFAQGQKDKLHGLDAKFFYDAAVTPQSLRVKERKLGQRSVSLVFEIKSHSDVKWLYENERSYELHLAKNLTLNLDDGRTFIISSNTINDIGIKTFELNETQKDQLLNGLNGFKSIYYDKFDLGWRESTSDTTASENYLEFAKSINIGSLTNNTNLFIEFEGFLSTDINDVASYLQVSPLYLRFGKDKKWHINASYQTSANLDEQRAIGRISWRGIIDSPFDKLAANLSTGTNRIRLKPYLNVGVSAMYFTESLDPEIQEGYFIEPFLSFLYIIPIADKYTARLDTYAYWRSTRDDFNLLTENLNWQGTIQLEYGIGSNAQLVGKYSYGTFGLTNETNNRLMFGFATELFKNLD